MFLYLFGVVLHYLPLNGGYDPTVNIGWSTSFIFSAIRHSVLPGATIVLAQLGGWMLSMRNMTLTTLSEDYVWAAEAKGLRSLWVSLGYAARNAILPSVTGFAISLGFVVSGSIIMEIVFSYPGIGYTLLQAVQNDDYALMQGISWSSAWWSWAPTCWSTCFTGSSTPAPGRPGDHCRHRPGPRGP